MPTTPTLTAGQVMDASASALNDTAKSQYTYAVQIPYLNMALRKLQEEYEAANIPVTDTVTGTEILVLQGATSITFAPSSPLSIDYLPDDLIEPKLLWQRISGINPYIPMSRVDYLPRWQEGIELNQFLNYTWQSNEIRFLSANTDIDIKMDYIRRLFVTVDDEDDELNVINAQSYLSFMTASFIAKFVEENDIRAQNLMGEAEAALDRAEIIGTKGRQAIFTRRRPFRQGFKNQYLR